MRVCNCMQLTVLLFRAQTWMMMLGYVHKDKSQPHFKIALHNVDETEIAKGIAEWQSARMSYEDDKIMITKANMFHRLAAWRLNGNPESDNDFLHDMTDMLNSKKYMIATGFVTCSGAMRYSAARAMYKLIKGIHPMELQDTMDLLFAPQFSPRPGAAVPADRYYNGADAPVRSGTPIRADDGFLASDNPDGALPPTDRSQLCEFVQEMLAGGTSEQFTTPSNRREKSSNAASIPIRPHSPMSDDSGEHSSDGGFIDDSNL